MKKKARRKTEGPVPPDGIQILIDTADRPFCRPYYGHVHPGDTVQWHFAGTWVIDFGKRTPLKGKRSVVRGSGNQPSVRIAPSARGHYPYSIIAVEVDEQRTPTIYYDLACPEIITP